MSVQVDSKPSRGRPRTDEAGRFWTKVDKTRGCWVWTGAVLPDGYGVFNIRLADDTRRMEGVHRYAYRTTVGPIPEGMQVDHICHTRNCVRPDHLRAVVPHVNAQNRKGAQAGSASGIRNVHKVPGGWRVLMRACGESHYFGTFPTIEEAERVATIERARLYGTPPPASLP